MVRAPVSVGLVPMESQGGREAFTHLQGWQKPEALKPLKKAPVLVFSVFTGPELRTAGVNISVNRQHPIPKAAALPSQPVLLRSCTERGSEGSTHQSHLLSCGCSKGLPTTSRQGKNSLQSLTCPLHLKEGKEEQKVFADSHPGWLSKAWDKK